MKTHSKLFFMAVCTFAAVQPISLIIAQDNQVQEFEEQQFQQQQQFEQEQLEQEQQQQDMDDMNGYPVEETGGYPLSPEEDRALEDAHREDQMRYGPSERGRAPSRR